MLTREELIKLQESDRKTFYIGHWRTYITPNLDYNPNNGFKDICPYEIDKKKDFYGLYNIYHNEIKHKYAITDSEFYSLYNNSVCTVCANEVCITNQQELDDYYKMLEDNPEYEGY